MTDVPPRVLTVLPTAKPWVLWPSIWTCRLLTKAYFRVQMVGPIAYPDLPFVAVINHASYLDLPVMAWAVRRRACFLGKAELFRVPVFGWWLRAIGGIPLHRGQQDANALDLALAMLRQGESVFMAPEGTRQGDADGRVRPRSGFVRLAQQAACPVVPIAVSGTGRALPPGARWPRPCKLRIQIGAPIRLPPVRAVPENLEVLQQQAQQVMAEIYRMKAALEAR